MGATQSTGGDLGRGASKKNGKKPQPKERNLTLDQLDRLLPFLERQVTEYEEHMRGKTLGAWEREYMSITAGNTSPATVSLHPANASKNRYKNIVAYDHSRVKVAPLPENGQSDYINANWVPGADGPKTCIACQGPVPEAFFAFWQMVFENKVNVIVMLTNEIEGGKLKCHRYWPEAGEAMQVAKGMTLTLAAEKPKPTYITRQITLAWRGETRQVTHFQYTAWPDHGVPNSASEMTHFRKTVHKELDAGVPFVVHCSAGVGRSGTFLALETLMSRAEALNGDLSVRDYVTEMRRARNYMVQTMDQYVFAHTAMVAALKRSIAKTKRAIRARQAELAAGGDGLGRDADDLDELEDELEDAADAAEGLAGVPAMAAVTEGLRTLSRRASQRPRFNADAVYSHYSLESDLPALHKVPRDVRVASLAQSAGEDAWRARAGGDALSPEDKGYALARALPLDARMESLRGSAHPDAWRARIDTAQGAWHAGEEYEVTAALSAIDSRIASLAQTQENWLHRSEEFHRAVEEDTQVILHGLSGRLDSLATSIAAYEQRHATARSLQQRDLEAAVKETPLRARLEALQDAATRDHFVERTGREVENPKDIIRRAEEERERVRAAELAEQQRAADEAYRLAHPPPKGSQIKPAPFVGERDPAVKEDKKDVPQDPLLAPPSAALRPAAKEDKPHPMLAQAMAAKSNNVTMTKLTK